MRYSDSMYYPVCSSYVPSPYPYGYPYAPSSQSHYNPYPYPQYRQPFVSNTVMLKDLYQYGNAFNIEGGIPALNLQGGDWINLVAILDRPFIDAKTLEEITQENIYPLKESSILGYNEARVNLAITTILMYYILHGRQIRRKTDQKMIFQIHRGSSGKLQLDLYKRLLRSALGTEVIEYPANPNIPGSYGTWSIPAYNTTLEYRFGYWNEFLSNYGDADFLFSFSLAGGLTPNYPTGTLEVPVSFIPFNEEVTPPALYLGQKYSVTNRLMQDLDSIFSSPIQQQLISIINNNPGFLSPNPEKQFMAMPISANDFVRGTTDLQIKGLWNPKNIYQEVQVVG